MGRNRYTVETEFITISSILDMVDDYESNHEQFQYLSVSKTNIYNAFGISLDGLGVTLNDIHNLYIKEVFSEDGRSITILYFFDGFSYHPVVMFITEGWIDKSYVIDPNAYREAIAYLVQLYDGDSDLLESIGDHGFSSFSGEGNGIFEYKDNHVTDYKVEVNLNYDFHELYVNDKILNVSGYLIAQLSEFSHKGGISYYYDAVYLPEHGIIDLSGYYVLADDHVSLILALNSELNDKTYTLEDSIESLDYEGLHEILENP